MESVFDKLEIKPEAVSTASDEITKEELLVEKGGSPVPLEILLGAVSVRMLEGSTYNKPLEIWHGLTRSPSSGSWLMRTIRGQSHLAGQLRAQARDNGLAFLNVESGETEGALVGLGAWNLVYPDGRPALLAAKLRIDKSRGAQAGKGQRVAYFCASAAVELARAVQLVPSLPLTDRYPALALDE